MALPNAVLSGFSATLYAQPTASPTPLTTAQLSLVASTAPIAVIGNIVNIEAMPPIGQDDAMASFTVAGSRQSDKIPTQSAPSSMTITAAWNPSDATLLLIRGDAYSGVVDRTYVVAFVLNANIVYYSFNARASEFKIDAQPNAEAKCIFTLHPRGNQYGWSNNA
ncbi:hypothetical protein UFOVP11_28 [uncultured Caudovirales phage]|uniref:Uncharacterized protein n=1 Tax=uncultured Caudovirales phage TaxID=2100421 RepID=A0A6J5KIU3_9CAUD|nr:hypothetical protein UFOVP11_28 [uncultured Caudovirales phage]